MEEIKNLIKKYESELEDAKKLKGDAAYAAVKIFTQIIKDLNALNL